MDIYNKTSCFVTTFCCNFCLISILVFVCCHFIDLQQLVPFFVKSRTNSPAGTKMILDDPY